MPTAIKTLQKKALNLWKEACFKRDGKQCMVKRHFPNIDVKHSPILQVDHMISRRSTRFRVDIRNGTVVCRTCNMLKARHVKSVDKAIELIRKNRESPMTVETMFKQDMLLPPFHNWKDREWLEQKIKELEEYANN